jgi:chromosome segregation ATPase
VSAAADRKRPALPHPWAQLERAAREAAAALGRWKQRALEAEEEVGRLRRSLEDLADSDRPPADDATEELRRLRAENAALRSRMAQARKRVSGLMQRLSALEVDR